MTTFGLVELAIPRDREGRYYPSFRFGVPWPQMNHQPYARLVDVGGQPQARFQ